MFFFLMIKCYFFCKWGKRHITCDYLDSVSSRKQDFEQKKNPHYKNASEIKYSELSFNALK